MMSIKSLILGSAAGLVAMSGAQAADLPVKAKAVEYVKICSLYGAGFYYIPGTDTCIKLGGYLRVETALNSNSVFNGAYSGVAGAQNRLRNYYTARSRENLSIDTRTATEYGVVRTFWEGGFVWTTPNPTLAGTFGNAGIAGGDTVGLYHAFIQFAGFTMGKTYSQFDAPWTNYPANSFDGLVGGSGTVTGVNQFTYTGQFGNGVTAAISAQDQVAYSTTILFNTSFPGVTAANVAAVVGSALAAATPYGVQSLGGAAAPDLIATISVDQAWGFAKLSLAAHDNHTNYYTAANESSGHPSDKWGWAIQGALSLKNIPTGPGDTINLQAVYTDGASRYNFQSLAPVTLAMFGGTGLEGAYQSLGFASVSDGVFSGTSSATGTGLQLTQTWGFRGGYTHNWDPYWNSTIFGAWATVHHNDTAKALMCANVAAVAVAGTGFTCNPDFSVAQIGTTTRWTPVKNLTFSGEVVYSMLDQKYTGAVTLPAIGGLAKPAAVYELKDQSTWTFLARAQRNF
ncbi:polymerase [Bradyrhizobium sp. NAS80.1]|uniref:porin n=1 Tax=Bradyrhizobium sp. NAS80.1 TaxID=1680159 RepID=UPI00095B1982|nr:porin [Bradyrhizobium sp. NAS80.1]OKO87666.1 polymerase [Bradyrhizobium sp. NAS80.1]